MTGTTVKIEIQNRRYEYSNTLRESLGGKSERNALNDSQARAPGVINLEPPQDADTHDVLVESVFDQFRRRAPSARAKLDNISRLHTTLPGGATVPYADHHPAPKRYR